MYDSDTYQPTMYDRMYNRYVRGASSPDVDYEDEDKDSVEPIATSWLRSFIERASMRGEQPSGAIFDKHYKDSISPARELLANVLAGVSSSMTGQEFKTVRQRKFEEFMTQKKIEQEQEQMQLQRMNAVAQIAQNVYQQRKDEELKMRLKKIEAAQSQEERVFRTMQLGSELQDKIAGRVQQRELADAARFEPKDPLLQSGLQFARMEFNEKGLDPDDAENALELKKRAVEIANEIYLFRENNKKFAPRNPNAGIGALSRLYDLKEYTDGWGNVSWKPVNKLTGQPDNLRPWETPENMKNFSDAQINKMAGFEEAKDSMNAAVGSAVEAIRRGENPVGKFVDALPQKLRSVLMGVPANERNIRALFNRAVGMNLLALSGVAVSKHEEDRIQQGLPAFYEKPENFIPGALAFVNMLDAALLRNRAGIDPNQIGLHEVFDEYNRALQDSIKKGQMPKRIATGRDLLEIAAKAKGFELFYDNEGKVRGARRKAGK